MDLRVISPKGLKSPFSISKTEQMSMDLLWQCKLSVIKKKNYPFHLEIINWLHFEFMRLMLCHANELFMFSAVGSQKIVSKEWSRDGQGMVEEWSKRVLWALYLSFIRKEALLGTLKTVVLWWHSTRKELKYFDSSNLVSVGNIAQTNPEQHIS